MNFYICANINSQKGWQISSPSLTKPRQDLKNRKTQQLLGWELLGTEEEFLKNNSLPSQIFVLVFSTSHKLIN